MLFYFPTTLSVRQPAWSMYNLCSQLIYQYSKAWFFYFLIALYGTWNFHCYRKIEWKNSAKVGFDPVTSRSVCCLEMGWIWMLLSLFRSVILPLNGSQLASWAWSGHYFANSNQHQADLATPRNWGRQLIALHTAMGEIDWCPKNRVGSSRVGSGSRVGKVGKKVGFEYLIVECTCPRNSIVEQA